MLCALQSFPFSSQDLYYWGVLGWGGGESHREMVNFEIPSSTGSRAQKASKEPSPPICPSDFTSASFHCSIQFRSLQNTAYSVNGSRGIFHPLQAVPVVIPSTLWETGTLRSSQSVFGEDKKSSWRIGVVSTSLCQTGPVCTNSR